MSFEDCVMSYDGFDVIDVESVESRYFGDETFMRDVQQSDLDDSGHYYNVPVVDGLVIDGNSSILFI